MEPVASWSTERVTEWLKGLDAPLQQYPFSEWQLSGSDLLQLSSSRLENIGVHKIGHQELILEAVEKLCALTYSVGGDSLRSLTEKLRAVAHTLQMSIQGRWRVNSNDAQSATNLPQQVLQAVVDVIIASNGLVSVLNRYQFEQQTGYTANVKVAALCKDLDTNVHKETAVFEKEKDIISICRQLVAVCDEILTVSPLPLLTHTTQLESVDLVPASPGDQVGIEITTTGSRNHFVTGIPTEFPAEICEKILEGDEVIQVNGQIVVGWSRKNLVKKLEENPDGVTLVVRRLPGFLKRKESRAKSEREEPEEGEEEKSRHSLLGRVAASVRSLSFRSATDSTHHFRREKSALANDQSSNEYQSGTLKRLQPGTDSPRASRNSLEVKISAERSPSPQELNRSSTSSCPDMAGLREEKENKKSSTKGMRTAMSRRRVSCRELGRPDCDGWLWKKRKEAGVFMTQKWQRFWFVLKGPTLYWYNSQQEEKAEGLIKIGSYNIESAGEHKRKYVFKMCHPRFQNFFFAADNVTDMSKWINCLITAIQKHKKYAQSQPDSEEDCYSETESEEESSRSPLPHRKKLYTKTQTQSNTLPRTKVKQNRMSEPITISQATGSKIAGNVDEMDEMFNSIKKGGVTLIGQKQPMTHDQLRKSFIKRNKNPVINEKIHTLRALQSTLKAKEAELHLINRILEDSEFTPQKYRQWKQFNEELLQDIEKLHKLKDSPSTDTANKVSDEARALSLSDGEQLVDADAPDDGDSTPTNAQVPMQTQSTDTDETSIDSYFYI
ncbi:connector enhancer of kinase suppressor of ras 1 [Danio rerio]|uniref:connector enhancer of kinase suppressor of Ras 1 n=1 Tax=Danio rerio TaxID=7955 RepID=Q6P0K1_DANRE|nr:connector enhancer of kinase suppressor of ras 1 [Danio rerio]AAH65587.1 Connector enhancer of kinase suppressor of Ras 1 [Danio rerio]|eukprot:NP_991222.1 connector enhancer of kinase suppressor of ras 1 [Danio rerio]